MAVPPTPPLQDVPRDFDLEGPSALSLRLKTKLHVEGISPPTPAPSPQPHDVGRRGRRLRGALGWTGDARGGLCEKGDEDEGEERDGEREGTPLLMARDDIRRFARSLDARGRRELLEIIVAECESRELPDVLSSIESRLKRDFLQTLPPELALHVLSFVDEPKTLARASAVSRYWRALLEDEATWQRMCWRSGFGACPEKTLSTGEKLKTLEFGERAARPTNTPAGRSRKLERIRSTNSDEIADYVLRTEQARQRTSGQPYPRRGGGGGGDVPWSDLGYDVGSDNSEGSELSVQRGFHFERERQAAGAGGERNVSVEGPVSDELSGERSQSTERPHSVNPRVHYSIPLRNSQVTPAYAAEEAERHRVDLHESTSGDRNGQGGLGLGLLPSDMVDDSGDTQDTGRRNENQSATTTPREPSFLHSHITSHGMDHRSYAASKGSSPSVATSSSFSLRAPLGDDDEDHHTFSYKTHFKQAYLTESSWLRGPGRRIASQYSRDDGVVTGLAYSNEYIIVAMDKPSVYVFSAETGAYLRSLIGHELGVWSLAVAAPGGSRRTGPPGPMRNGGMGIGAGGPTGIGGRQAAATGVVSGWGQTETVVVSGACDRQVRVWHAETGRCVHVLRGHTSTVRCLEVLEGKPVAVSGSRDGTLRVWDLEEGTCLHVLRGHEHSVRSMSVYGDQVVSGSYDSTCRLWDTQTGVCLRVFEGHLHQIYSVAFDGVRVVTGSLDATVRVWSADTGAFIALLQGHTALVGHLQLDPISKTLVTGGSDGKVIVFSLETYEVLHRLCAHDNSVTSVQFDDRFVVSSGNDGHIFLWDFRSGQLIREMGERSDGVWRVTFRDDKGVVLFKRNGKPMIELTEFKP